MNEIEIVRDSGTYFVFRNREHTNSDGTVGLSSDILGEFKTEQEAVELKDSLTVIQN